MRVMVGVTFMIAVAALLLHLRPLIPMSSSFVAPSESLGARLQRECESVVDTANVTISSIEVFMHLEHRAELEQELKSKNVRYLPDKIDYLKANRPEVWNTGIDEALAGKRAKMIRECVLQRGTRSN